MWRETQPNWKKENSWRIQDPTNNVGYNFGSQREAQKSIVWREGCCGKANDEISPPSKYNITWLIGWTKFLAWFDRSTQKERFIVQRQVKTWNNDVKTRILHLLTNIMSQAIWGQNTFFWLLKKKFFTFCFLQFYCPNWISPMGNSGRLPWGKPAATVALPNLWCMLDVFGFP